MRVSGFLWRSSRPERVRRRRWLGLAVAALGVVVPAALGSGTQPKAWVELSLEKLGFPGVSNTLLATGGSVLTVNFIDSGHLLVTFGLRKLVPRVERDPDSHEDRLVAAEVVDLPSGHIAAETEWHMHDHGRYLWALGSGRFLVRIGDQMYTIAPLERAASGDAFQRTLFPGRPLRPSFVNVSSDGGVVTVETVLEQNADDSRTKVYLGDMDSAPTSRTSTMIDFYRVDQDGEDAGVVKAAGRLQSAEPVLLPVDADGYLWPVESGAGEWAVSFDEFGGKTIKLGKIRSSCFPRLQMVSRSEFVALTCQGSDDRIKMASYGLDGHDTWEEILGDFGRPGFAFAPAAARFAISGSAAVGGAEVIATAASGPAGPTTGPRQEMRVYQNASGDLLLRVECTPVFKTAENFDLSADGMLAAAVRGGAIGIYKLPPLSKRDTEDMEEIASSAPPASKADVVLRRLTVPATAARTAASASLGSLGPSGAVPAAVDDGRIAGMPRKPPTLLKQGEKPVFGKANPEPQ